MKGIAVHVGGSIAFAMVIVIIIQISRLKKFFIKMQNKKSGVLYTMSLVMIVFLV